MDAWQGRGRGESGTRRLVGVRMPEAPSHRYHQACHQGQGGPGVQGRRRRECGAQPTPKAE